MTTESKRDLHADLAICEAASSGYIIQAAAVVGERGPYLNVDVYNDNCDPLTSDDAIFIVEAREGWPHSIRRAIAAEARVVELCESNAYYIKAAERAEEEAHWTEMDNVRLRDENVRLREALTTIMRISSQDGIAFELDRCYVIAREAIPDGEKEDAA